MDKDKCVVIDCEEEEDEEKEDDWLPPPPDVPANLLKIAEGSTIKKLRYAFWSWKILVCINSESKGWQY